MAYATVYCAQPGALKATLITVETDVSVGLYNFMIVGLPNKEVDESKDRVAAAIKNSGLPSPKSENRKIVTNLSPGSVRKEGSHFDLAIALAYLKATKYLEFEEKDKLFVGELSLSGEISAVQGVLSIAILVKENGIKELYVPYQNKEEAALVEGITIFPVKNLKEIIEHLKKEKTLESQSFLKEIPSEINLKEDPFIYIKGQEVAERALT
jgi:magnesium chelatase family protein